MASVTPTLTASTVLDSVLARLCSRGRVREVLCTYNSESSVRSFSAAAKRLHSPIAQVQQFDGALQCFQRLVARVRALVCAVYGVVDCTMWLVPAAGVSPALLALKLVTRTLAPSLPTM